MILERDAQQSKSTGHLVQCYFVDEAREARLEALVTAYRNLGNDRLEEGGKQSRKQRWSDSRKEQNDRCHHTGMMDTNTDVTTRDERLGC